MVHINYNFSIINEIPCSVDKFMKYVKEVENKFVLKKTTTLKLKLKQDFFFYPKHVSFSGNNKIWSAP